MKYFWEYTCYGETLYFEMNWKSELLVYDDSPDTKYVCVAVDHVHTVDVLHLVM